MSLDLDALMAQANNLTPLPTSAARLAVVVTDPDSSLSSITEVISLDPALTIRILRAANSALSASRFEVTEINDAVVRMGRGIILALAVGTGTHGYMRPPVPVYGLQENALWRHSVSAAMVAEHMGPFCNNAVPPEAFAAALLHDIGKIVIGRFLDAQTLSLLTQAQLDGQRDPLEAEREILGVNHAELGGLLAHKWGLPKSIVEGITHHHQPDEGRQLICDVICVANQLANQTGLANTTLPQRQEDHSASYARLGIRHENQQSICEAVQARFAQVLERFGA